MKTANWASSQEQVGMQGIERFMHALLRCMQNDGKSYQKGYQKAIIPQNRLDRENFNRNIGEKVSKLFTLRVNAKTLNWASFREWCSLKIENRWMIDFPTVRNLWIMFRNIGLFLATKEFIDFQRELWWFSEWINGKIQESWPVQKDRIQFQDSFRKSWGHFPESWSQILIRACMRCMQGAFHTVCGWDVDF